VAAVEPERLTKTVRSALDKGPLRFSVISYWEVVVKSMKGSLNVGDPRAWWRETVNELALEVLPLRSEHVAEVFNLSPVHSDPFDRALVAQAIVEDLTLVTLDETLTAYASQRLRILR
jgi:PIN domain nuclease of toxin-antitoxin system